MTTPADGPDQPVQRESAIRRLRQRWRIRHERRKRLIAARYVEHSDTKPDTYGGGPGF